MSGYVYILTNPSFRDDWVKIGIVTDSESYQGGAYWLYKGQRLATIRDQIES